MSIGPVRAGREQMIRRAAAFLLLISLLMFFSFMAGVTFERRLQAFANDKASKEDPEIEPDRQSNDRPAKRLELRQDATIGPF